LALLIDDCWLLIGGDQLIGWLFTQQSAIENQQFRSGRI
jgi:hypothetical protein